MTKLREQRDFRDAVCQPFLLEGGEHGVLLLHGFTGSAAHMRPLGEGLHAQGFTVMGINLPGHAQSMEAMGRTGWQDWLEAAKEAMLQLQKRCRYVSIAGLSMGGCLALILAEQMQPTAVAAISAPMAVKNRLLPLAGVVSPLMPTIWWRPRPEGSPNPLDDRYDYGYPGFPTRCGADLNRLIRMARKDLHAIQCPLLVFQSHQDGTIAPESAEVILTGAGSTRKGVMWFDDMPHVLTISPVQNRIIEAAGEHFRHAEVQ